MIKYCRKIIPSYNTMVKEWKKDYIESKEELSNKFPILFKEEHSFDINPIGALHITLITIKSDTPESIIIDIIKEIEDMLTILGINKGDQIFADRIDIKLPITRNFIDILKYVPL